MILLVVVVLVDDDDDFDLMMIDGFMNRLISFTQSTLLGCNSPTDDLVQRRHHWLPFPLRAAPSLPCIDASARGHWKSRMVVVVAVVVYW